MSPAHFGNLGNCKNPGNFAITFAKYPARRTIRNPERLRKVATTKTIIIFAFSAFFGTAHSGAKFSKSGNFVFKIAAKRCLSKF